MSEERGVPPAGRKLEMVLVRHGQSTVNATGVWQGQLDFPLSDEGRRQAATAGRALATENVVTVYASPLLRAFETARIVAREAGYGGEIIPEPGLMERHGGVLEGHTWAEQEETNPDFARKFLSLPEEERWAFAGAETDEDVLGRFEEAIKSILARQRASSGETGGPFIVVSHGGVMRAYLRDLFGPEVLPGSERAPNASITRLLFDPSEPDAPPELADLASTAHLSDEQKEQARTRVE